MKKMLTLLLTAALALGLAVPAMAAESDPVVILHTLSLIHISSQNLGQRGVLI